MYKAKVLLLDAHTVQTLPIAKSLRNYGCHVTAACEEKLSYGWFSRFPHKKILSPSASKEPERFLTFLRSELKEGKYDVVIPLFDDSADILGHHKSELERYAKIAVPDFDIFIRGHDKNLTMQAAKEVGIPHPKTADLEALSLEEAAAYTGFPALIKPNVGAGAKGITKVESLRELQALYPKIKQRFGACALQEFIPPGGRQFKCQIFRDKDGTIKGASTFVKHRYYPVSGGTTSCGEVVDIPELVEYATKVADKIGWVGFADFDSIEDPRDGKFKLMEINARITGSIKAGILSGVDYAQMIVAQEMGWEVPSFESKSGLFMRQFSLDVMWFLSVDNKRRFSTYPNWFKFFGKTMRYQDGEWSDPLPMVAGFIAGAKKLLDPEFRKSKNTMNKKEV